MGCSDSKAADALSPPDMGMSSMKAKLTERLLSSDALKKRSKNAFASVLNKYPDSKKVFRVPETTKTDTELIETKEVKAASDKLLDHYMDIAKTADSDLDATLKRKAEDLNKQGVKAEYIKCYGESLVQNSTNDASSTLSKEEESAWKVVINQITSKLTAAMGKLPKSSP